MKKSTYLFALALGASTLTFAQVGIGTSTPSSPLDIQADDAAIDLNSEAADGSRDPKINFQLTGTTTFSIGLDDADDDKLKIGVGAPETSTRMTIDGSGNVGIGNTSPTATLDVDGSAIFNESGAAVDFRVEGDTEANLLFVDGSADMVGIGTSSPSRLLTVAGSVDLVSSSYVALNVNQTDAAMATLGVTSATTQGFINVVNTEPGHLGTNPEFKILLNTTEMFRINGDGEVGIGTSNPQNKLHVENNFGIVARFDRTGDDGTVVSISQDGTTEGTISVSGNTVTYNGFTGSHYAYSKEETFERGMLVSFNGSNEHFHNNPKSEILYGINYTAKANDSRIAGVFFDLCESTKEISLDNPYQIMAVGNGDVWVTDEGGDIATGDYLISSSTVGHAMKDNGDYEVSHIFAKATESVDWSTVEPDSNGVKRKKIIVYFEAFDKPNYEKKFKEQQAIIESQKAEIESLKAEATNSSAETNQKLDSNTSEIEALKAQVQQMLQLLQQQESVSAVK